MAKVIDRDELKEILNDYDPSVKIVDVLSKEYYDKEHIKGAISLPVDSIDDYAQEKLCKSDRIIVYCANTKCQASTMAAKKLDVLGYKNVYDYEEGLQGYKEAGLPVEGSETKMAVGSLRSVSGGACCN